MKAYVGIGIAVVSVVTLGSIAALLNSRGQSDKSDNAQPTTIVTSTTTSTENNDKVDKNNKNSPQDGADTKNTSATYTNFTSAAFKQKAGTVRILLFYDKTHSPSIKLDTLLIDQIKSLPKNTHVYKVILAEQQELATELGVSQPGTTLKYNADNQLSGVYVATDSTDLATFRKVLSLE